MSTSKKPYKLPQQMLCSLSNIEHGIDMQIVNYYIQKHQATLQRYKYLDNLYKGFHDVFNLPEKEEWKPDNRLAVNFPRYITETFMGYGYGIPIKKTHPDEDVLEAIKKFDNNNEMTDHDYELFRKACIFGHAWEYFYQDEEARTKVTICTPMELFVVYDDTMRRRALFAIRYGYHDRDSDQPYQLFGEILTRESIRSFEGSRIVEDKDNPYGYIPVVEYLMNDDRVGIFEEIAGLVETYNRAIGEKANDVDSFAEAYLAILGAEVDTEGYYKIRDNRLINLYGTDNARDILVEFLQKPTADGTQENLLDRLEKLVYQISMVANISDENFGSNVSGTSLAYKLQAMSNLALGFDRKIEKSFKKRYKIFCSLGTNVPEKDKDAWQELTFTTSRNLPKNLLEEAQTAQNLEGIVSKDTQLSVLSIVNDTAAEIEKIDAEDEKLKSDAVMNRYFNENESESED